MNRLAACLLLAAGTLSGVSFVAARKASLTLGKQLDGTFLVSTGRKIEPGTISFDGRPIDLALHPNGQLAAVLGQNKVFLVDSNGIVKGTDVPLGGGASSHGIVWSPDGTKLFASVSDGNIIEALYDGTALTKGRTLSPLPSGAKGNPRPCGLALTRDGKTLFAASMDRKAVAQLDLESGKIVRELSAQNLPFDVCLSEDEKTLFVTNWGGRLATEEDEKNGDTIEAAGAVIVADPRGFSTTGTVSKIDLATGASVPIPVGLHPLTLLRDGDRFYVANAGSDTISELSATTGKVTRTIPLKFGAMKLLGAAPSALALSPLPPPGGGGNEERARRGILYVACGGDNAVAEIDLKSGKVLGYRPAGYYPTALALATNPPITGGGGGNFLWALNTKGNGSVKNTVQGKPGNAHDFQGTISRIDLSAPLAETTKRVSALNGWERDRSALNPKNKVFQGAIQHVIYIIKENRTYDEVFGDMPEGDGDPKLCGLGEEVTPNVHALARQFTLFDNGYVTGTNSADGHQWTDGAIANDYLEHMYTGYRTYPDSGSDPMGSPASGYLWDAALKAKKSVRIYGEFCDDSRAIYTPQPADWLEMWKDRGVGRIKTQARPLIPMVAKLCHPNYLYWPLYQSDQARADIFLGEYAQMSKENRVPNLMVMSLPCDHTEGLSPKYPKPKSMVADNDLALGRIVEGVSKSKEWASTAIFVIEDDAQAGPDHVDGHRTVFACYSPFVKRKFVDSNLYTTVTMLSTIEKMLGISPMTRFDALTPPMTECFSDTPDLTPFASVPNRIKLDDMNAPRTALAPSKRKWFDLSASLDWSGIDKADFQSLNRILWADLHGEKPYPFPDRRATVAAEGPDED